MQRWMLLLEIVIVLLIAGEVVIRWRRKFLRARKKKASASPATSPRNVSTQVSTPATPIVAPARSTLPAESVPDSPETLDMQDLLREADIYLTYGHHAQAATVLRWYVDLHPQDSRAINKLLDTYTAMADMAGYADLLERLGEKPHAAALDADWWQRRIQEGLQQDPGNLELLVLAEKVGMAIPMPSTASSEAASPMTAKMALALVSRNPDPRYGMAILWRALLQDPLHLALYAEWLRITHQQHLLEEYLNGVILLFMAVGAGGNTLRARVLRAGKDLGPHPLWETLSTWSGNAMELQHLAESRHLEIPALLLKKNA